MGKTKDQDPYSTCAGCLVKDWCGRRSGKTPLPADYGINPECNGYVMLEQAFKLSNIPPEYRNANRDKFIYDQDNVRFQPYFESVFDTINEQVEKGNNLGFIHPQKGTGKTYTAVSFAMEYLLNNVLNPEAFDFENPLVLYVKYGTWANELRQVYQLNDEDYNLKILRSMQRMKEVPLLVLDDIGSGRLTDYVRDLTYDLIDYRKEHKLSTFFTSNLGIPQLEGVDRLGDIITSRLLYNTTVFQLGGRNRREEKMIIID
ncbi:ATP-binding protein [Bacillus haynesii]|uniref:ATP-binding protein n=1 Tax=Bacillus haynesii TaxID=1925021 RepID=UPI00228093EA|nr:ATP-binding protein [Bacillus haynesii]MCY7861087.1 ATP-binding protein [Bacillus haynesii]MCY8015584.1 ATP-binding protein [Bacillus haynesii]MCY8291582.1 ATP-binding protein [Bacillus haynesii]MCY8549207.1 ATP-binding protein [Bacillus haynesii]